MNYYIPNNLLSTENAKTSKGEKLGITTYISYLSPHTQILRVLTYAHMRVKVAPRLVYLNQVVPGLTQSRKVK